MQVLESSADPQRAVELARFFKTGPGQYGENDRFRGIGMPALRKLIKPYAALPLKDLDKLVRSPWHEDRMAAFLIALTQYEAAIPDMKKQLSLYHFFVRNLRFMNNWDLVDVTAPGVIGAWLHDFEDGERDRWAASADLWERRVAIVSTLYSIRLGRFEPTLRIADALLIDSHDLIHKAVGWMLREVGKRKLAVMEDFLAPRYARMPRTALRYAIERLPQPRRQAYLKGRV